MTGRRIYLDHNATSPATGELRSAWLASLVEPEGNPSASHAEGRATRERLERARDAIAASMSVGRERVVLTSGGSEADALSLRGAVEAGLADTLVISSIEHPAVTDTAKSIASAGRAELRVVPADRDGLVDPAAVGETVAREKEAGRKVLVSIISAQNEIGTVQDVRKIAEQAKRHGALVHTDAVQAYGKISIDVGAWGVDMVSVSAHKIGGPMGAGALVVAESFPLEPYCPGGGQEGGLRCGTEALAALLGFGAAAERLEERLATCGAQAELRDRFERSVVSRDGGCLVLGAEAPRLPNTSALLFEGARGDRLVAACDAQGVAISAGSACHSGAEGPPPIVATLGIETASESGMLRVSLGPETTEAEMDRAADVIVEAASGARRA